MGTVQECSEAACNTQDRSQTIKNDPVQNAPALRPDEEEVNRGAVCSLVPNVREAPLHAIAWVVHPAIFCSLPLAFKKRIPFSMCHES